MKRIFTLLVIFFTIVSTYSQKSPSGDIWLHMLTTGQPAVTRYLGDQLNAGSSWYINFEVGQASWNQTDCGVGKSNSDPSGFTWRTANWYENGSGSNKRVRSDFGDFRFTSTGNWYFVGRAKADAGDPWHYANSDAWTNTSSFAPIYYFLVNALNDPGSQTATLSGSNPTSQIDLSWSKDAQNHNVMIVRKKSSESWTEPTQGTAYSVGTSIGSGVVVYNSNGTTFSNTGLSSSTGYDYKFYSENWSYYSDGVTSSTVNTSSASSDYYRSKATGNWNATGTWESSNNNSNWVNATLTPGSSSNTTTIKSGHTVTVNTAATVNALTIESTSVLSISSGNSLTVSGVLTNSGSASGLVVESGGSLITNSTVSGSATIKREITSDNKWHFLSSPVSGQSICDGNFAPTTSNFNASTGATYDFYKWSEATVSGNLNWLNLKNTDWTLNTNDFGSNPQFDVAKGYLVAYSSSFSGSSLKSFAGTLITGDQTVTLGNSGNKWNLIGNPFPSAINWDNVTKTSLDSGYYYIYNEAKNGGPGYEQYLDATHKTSGANGKISSCQGFFVKASGTSLTLPNSARVHDNNWMKSIDTELSTQLIAKLGNASNYDEAFLVFEEQGISGRNHLDGDKLMSMNSGIPQLYSIVGIDNPVAINSLPYSFSDFSVDLGSYIPTTSDYYLEISGIESFPIPPGILLEDVKLGTFQDLVSNPVYTFQAEGNEDPKRFVLHFSGLTQVEENAKLDFGRVITHNRNILIMYSGVTAGQATVADISGRVVASVFLQPGENHELKVIDSPGVYIVRISNEEGAMSKKIILNQ